MKKNIYKIEEYTSEFKEKGFNYEKGMTLDSLNEPIYSKEYKSLDEALKDFKKYKSSINKRSYNTTYYLVEEYTITKYELDEDDEILESEYIEISDVDEIDLRKLYLDIIRLRGVVVDFIENEEKEIKVLIATNDNYYLANEFLKINELKEDFEIEELKEVIYDEYLDDLTFTEYKSNPIKK